MKYRSEITSETDTTILGETYVQIRDDGPWEFLSNFYRSKVDLWFVGEPHDILARLGIQTDPQRASEFSDLLDGDIDGFYYLSEASDGTDEAVKWIMGPVAAALNERGLPFSKVREVIPADYLRTFIEYLKTSKFEKTFAKDIFSELMNASIWVDDGIWEEKGVGLVSYLDWDAHVAAVEAVEERLTKGYDSSCASTIAGFRRCCGAEQLDRIVSDPRFSAVGGDEIDSIIESIVSGNPDQVAKVAAKPALVQWFVGQVMKAAKGKAPAPEVLAKIKIRLGISD